MGGNKDAKEDDLASMMLLDLDQQARNAKKQLLMTKVWIMGLATSRPVFYETLFIISGILTVVLDQPLYSVFSLMELCFWSGSKTVIDAIRFNISKMAQTMLLGLLTTYL